MKDVITSAASGDIAAQISLAYRYRDGTGVGSPATFLKNVSLRHYTHNAGIIRTICQALAWPVNEKS